MAFSVKNSTRLVVLLALAGGCTGKDGILTSHEETGTGGDDDEPTGSGADGSDSGGCVTECPPEQFACIYDLAWNGALLGMAWRPIEANCPSCDNYGQLVLLTIDPVTAEQTPFAEGQENSRGSQMAVASDGSIFVAGSTDDIEALQQDALLLKFSPDGELLWQIKPDHQMLLDIVLSGDEVVVVAGGYDLIAFSAADGAPLWDVPNNLSYAHQVERDAAGALYVAGADSYPKGDALPSWYLRKYAADRTLLWEQVTPMTEDDRPDIDGLALDEAGGAVIAVRNNLFDTSPGDILLHKIAADGSPVWSHPFPTVIADVDTDDKVSEVMARPGGGVIVVGGIVLGSSGVAFALDPDGALLWQDLHQPEGLKYASHSAVTMAADTLLVSGCGRSDMDISTGWLFDPTP